MQHNVCRARAQHAATNRCALVDPSTLRRDLRSLSEIPSTLRRNLRSIAVSFFLPCEHNNRKADRIAFLNKRLAADMSILLLSPSAKNSEVVKFKHPLQGKPTK